MNNFKLSKTFEQRKVETDNMKLRHPERVCIYITKAKGSHLPDTDKHKYLVPNDLTVGQMSHVIRKRLKIDSAYAIFLFTANNRVPPNGSTISEIYKEHADADGFLYMIYNTEATFG